MAVEALLTAGGKWPTLPFPTFMYAGKDCSAVTWCASWDLPFRWEGTERSTEEEGRQDMERGTAKPGVGCTTLSFMYPVWDWGRERPMSSYPTRS